MAPKTPKGPKYQIIKRLFIDSATTVIANYIANWISEKITSNSDSIDTDVEEVQSNGTPIIRDLGLLEKLRLFSVTNEHQFMSQFNRFGRQAFVSYDNFPDGSKESSTSCRCKQGGNGDGNIKGKESEEKVLRKSSEKCPESDLHQNKRLVIKTEIDLITIFLFVLGILSRFWRLEEPRNIVFDELHYGKYASLYLKGTFFFDSHPPLGKQLIALIAYLVGFDGSFNFDKIGSAYTGCTPLWALRIVPAFFGSLIIPTVYLLALEMGLTRGTAILTGLLIILDNALLAQSRFILMESLLLEFIAFGLLALLRFRKLGDRPFSLPWCFWLVTMSISLTCSLCVKYIGFLSLVLALILLSKDFWNMLGSKRFSDKKVCFHLLAFFGTFIVIPTVIYISSFYIHLSLLTKAGPHNNIMTSAFQASLEGGLASITRGQPLEIAHGSQVTLRHTYGRVCWMHSHPHVYPLRYPDGRGSSHQQQVSCYSFKDVNNWWIVKRPDKNDLMVTEPIDKIKHGDIVQLVHGITSRALNSHDVAAAMTPQNQEVSCYIDYNISMPAENLWRLEIVNRDTEGDVWKTIASQIRLIHVNSSQSLKFSGRQLPEWGFHQHEIVTDRVINQEDTIWNVEEHRYSKSADQNERKRELGLAEFVPMAPVQLSFIEKMVELQLKMFQVNQENVQHHLYSSDPLEWPFLSKGVAYWVSSTSNAQIHLIGNLAIWYSGTASILIYLFLMVIYLLRRRRQCYDIPESMWDDFVSVGELLVGGYVMHYIPFFFADRTLFLHHYMPALLFKLLLIPALIEHVYQLIRLKFRSRIFPFTFLFVITMWTASCCYVYFKFLPLCYGHKALSAQEIADLRWKDTWDFIIHKP